MIKTCVHSVMFSRQTLDSAVCIGTHMKIMWPTYSNTNFAVHWALVDLDSCYNQKGVMNLLRTNYVLVLSFYYCTYLQITRDHQQIGISSVVSENEKPCMWCSWVKIKLSSDSRNTKLYPGHNEEHEKIHLNLIFMSGL